MLRKRFFGILLVIIAGCILASSGLAYSYEQTAIETMPGIVVEGVQIVQPVYNEVTTTPYRGYTSPLIIVSVALFAGGLTIMFFQSRNPIPKSKLFPVPPRS
jgi:hypothetical protein